MCTAENGRLANARIEKQMRQYLQKWGKNQARKESIKVQKYDLNSFKIANQRSSYGRISKRQNFTGGSVVINKNSYGGRFKNLKMTMMGNSGCSSSESGGTEEMMMSEEEDESQKEVI